MKFLRWDKDGKKSFSRPISLECEGFFKVKDGKKRTYIVCSVIDFQ